MRNYSYICKPARRLYLLLALLLPAGYLWIWLNFKHNLPVQCIFREITGLPCPSCGTTRAIITLIDGSFTGALLQNPLFIVPLAIMLILPVLLIYDLLWSSTITYRIYSGMENFLAKKAVFIPCIAVVLLSWIRNIFAGT